jgi:hypothetical protein
MGGDFIMSVGAYSSGYTHHVSQREERGVLQALRKRVRARFSRASKPVNHMGDLDLEDRLPPRVYEGAYDGYPDNENRDADIWSKEESTKQGSTHEYMEVSVG